MATVEDTFVHRMLSSESDWIIRQLATGHMWIGLEGPNTPQGKVICKIVKCRNHPMAHEINCCLLRCLSLVLGISLRGIVDSEAVKAAAKMMGMSYEQVQENTKIIQAELEKEKDEAS